MLEDLPERIRKICITKRKEQVWIIANKIHAERQPGKTKRGVYRKSHHDQKFLEKKIIQISCIYFDCLLHSPHFLETQKRVEKNRNRHQEGPAPNLDTLPISSGRTCEPSPRQYVVPFVRRYYCVHVGCTHISRFVLLECYS